jgi:hypothetical protein
MTLQAAREKLAAFYSQICTNKIISHQPAFCDEEAVKLNTE